MSARKVAVALLAFVVVGGMPMSGVAVQDAPSFQDAPDDEGITTGELEVVNLTLDNVTIRNLSVGSLDVADGEMADLPSSVDDRTVTVSATMQDVEFENVTVRNTSLARELLGVEGQSLQNRTEQDNETIETGQAVGNVTLADRTIDGAAFESVLVRNVTGNLSVSNASMGNQVGGANETAAPQNDTGAAPVIEAVNVTIGNLNATTEPAEDQEAEEDANETAEDGVDNETEAAEGGASDDIIGDENVTEPGWANKTGGNETDATSANWTNATDGNGTQIGGEVGEDLTSGNQSDATNVTNATINATNATNATNASVSLDG